MGVYIRDIWVPYVSLFDVDRGNRRVEIVRHIDKEVPPHFAEFPNPIFSANIQGTLIQNSTSPKTANDYANDVLSLLGSDVAYNYIHNYQNRSGWLSVSDAESPNDADTPLSREYAITGNFLPNTVYQTAMVSNPSITSNPWSFTLGSNECENYVAIPIGATYTGGDGSTITHTGKDGTITEVKATANNIIRYDVDEADVDNGEIKIFDDMDEASEADWIKVFNVDHVYTGKMVIENSLYRIILDPSSNRFALYAYYSSAYNKMDDFTCGDFNIVNVQELDSDKVTIKLNSTSTITLERGKPVKIDTTTETLYATSVIVQDASTSTNNFILLSSNIYVASDAQFSTIASTKDLDTGVKWLFYDTVPVNAEKVAHRALVTRNLKREVRAR